MENTQNEGTTGAYGQSLRLQVEAANVELSVKQSEVDSLKKNWELYQTSPDLFENIYSTAAGNSITTVQQEKAKALEARNAKSTATRNWNALTRNEQIKLRDSEDPIAKGRKIKDAPQD